MIYLCPDSDLIVVDRRFSRRAAEAQILIRVEPTGFFVVISMTVDYDVVNPFYREIDDEVSWHHSCRGFRNQTLSDH